ncbi:MAG: mandelate racemase/muconate lactonizing enzyme family protein [Chloroflexota bacterium]|nr:mandelate racemase/muconate lactonizing enzyme family protein [Chloroflexota bacterium]
MKITDIKVTSFSLGKLEKPYWNSIIRSTSRGFSRVDVYTDEGVVGMAPGGDRSRHVIEGRLKDLLVGEDPLRTDYLWQKMYMGGWRKPVAKGDHIGAMSAVDNALWDLRGKALGQPVWRMVGGAQSRVRSYAAGGYYQDGKGLKELCAEMETYVKMGYKAVKMKVGWSGVTLREDTARVEAVRKAIGPDVDLMVDANNAWDAITAIKFARMVEEYEPYWFEEPVHADDFRGGAQVCAALDMPVATGENEFTRWGFRDLIEAQAADIIQADPGICGGISEWIKIASMASAYHLNMAPHGGEHLGAVCVAAVSNGLVTETYPLHQEHMWEFMQRAQFEDGDIVMSDRPGLGIVWDEAAIERRLAKA